MLAIPADEQHWLLGSCYRVVHVFVYNGLLKGGEFFLEGRRHTRTKMASDWADAEGIEPERFSSLKECPSGTTMEFKISMDVTIAVANALRKSILGMVSSAAIDPRSVVVKVNTSDMHNEQLVHRLSMVPLHVSNPSSFITTACQVSLNAKNDARIQSSKKLITTENLDIVWTDPTLSEGEGRQTDTTRMVRPSPLSGEFIPLVVLRVGQEVELEGRVVVSTPIVDGAAFQNYLCSYGIDSDQQWICMRIESFIARDICEVVQEGINALRDACLCILDGVRIDRHADDERMFCLTLNSKADMTVCHLLQSFILQDDMDVLKDNGITFVGVHKPHPLRDTINFMVGIKSSCNVSCDEMQSTIAQYITALSMFLKQLGEEFNTFVFRCRLWRRNKTYMQRTQE